MSEVSNAKDVPSKERSSSTTDFDGVLDTLRSLRSSELEPGLSKIIEDEIRNITALKLEREKQNAAVLESVRRLQRSVLESDRTTLEGT